MGCGASNNKIHVSSTTDCVDNTKPAPDSVAPSPKHRPNSKSTKSRTQSAATSGSRQSAWGSRDSLGGSVDTRGGSAVSKASKNSMDSGFDDKDYARVITESSAENRVREVEGGFKTPRELDLGVVGQACQQRSSAKDRERMEEQRVLAALQNEGLIARPMARAGHGVRFDIVAADYGEDILGAKRRPPPRLEKLERRNKKKKRLTEADIEQKLARADERRKELEQQRLAKIQAVTMKSDVTNALDAFAARQKDIDTDVKSKQETVLENKMKKLNDMREKLRAKQAHAEAVRKRKLLAPLQAEEEEEDEIRTHKRITEDTPIGVSQEY